MKSSPRSTKDDFKQSRFSTQADFSNALSSNHALVTVAQEVAERLQQAYPPPSDDSNSVEAIMIHWAAPCNGLPLTTLPFSIAQAHGQKPLNILTFEHQTCDRSTLQFLQEDYHDDLSDH